MSYSPTPFRAYWDDLQVERVSGPAAPAYDVALQSVKPDGGVETE